MALEPIDYTSHSREIEEVYLSVVRGTDADTTWLIISPNDKKEYTPEYTGSGFTEFLEGFSDTKVQFGMARVCPPGSDVEKLILIGWCPDSAPLKTRASFASNFGTVANQVLRGYHVQVTARDEDDLDEKELLMKISNAAGARYSIQQQPSKTTSAPKPKPLSVPTPSKKQNTSFSSHSAEKQGSPALPTPASKPTFVHDLPKKPTVTSAATDAEDDGWGEPELEERDFDAKPLQPNQSTYKPIGKIDLQKVIAEENARDDPRLVNTVKSESFAKINPLNDIEKLKEESKLKRDAEINKFMGTKPPTASLPKKNDDMVIKGFQNEKSPAQIWAEKNQKSKSEVPKADIEDEEISTEEPDNDNDHEVSNIKAKFEKLSANEPAIIQPRHIKEPTKIADENPAPVKKMPVGQPLPGMHMEVEEENEQESDDDWDDDEDLPTATSSKLPDLPNEPRKPAAEPQMNAGSSIDQPDEEAEEDEEEQAPLPTRKDSVPLKEDDDDEEPVPSLPSRSKESSLPPPPPPRRATPSTQEPSLPSAIAEYDYDAGEDNELTFSEGDKIIHIDFVDEDWWLGELEKNGEKGLFPSNYVELIQ